MSAPHGNERTLDGRLLLNPLQEQSLWAEIAGTDGRMATLLEGPRHRLAAMAMEAHELLCAYAPRLLRESARSGWQQDAAAFSNWLAAFDETCRTGNLLSAARLPLELIPLLEIRDGNPAPAAAAGRLRPHTAPCSALFSRPGARGGRPLSDSPPPRSTSTRPRTHRRNSPPALSGAGSRLAANPSARLLVVTQDASRRRGEIERAFLKHTGPPLPPLFEFSLGVPLSQVALPHERSSAAALALRAACRARTRLAALHRPAAASAAGINRARKRICARSAAALWSSRNGPWRLYRPARRIRRLPAAWVERMTRSSTPAGTEFIAPRRKAPARLGRTGSAVARCRRHGLVAQSAFERRIPGRPPLAPGPGNLRLAGLRWPPHSLAGISLRFVPRTGRNPLCPRVPRRAHPDRRPGRVGGPHR